MNTGMFQRLILKRRAGKMGANFRFSANQRRAGVRVRRLTVILSKRL